jgi:putative flavoprotein involved in K+ transport
MSHATTTVIIGAGQAGLAFSRCLTDQGIDHVVLERGAVANSWRTERWDSLKLLTPNWQSRLPGFSYRGSDQDGYMAMPEVTAYLESYARSFQAPIHDQTSVLSVCPATGSGYEVHTDQAMWRARSVVIASGAFSKPNVPSISSSVPADVLQLAPNRYRNPQSIADGGVLVVGASASGIQIADELARSGRDVILAAGRHARMPRTYRGMDIQWWLDAIGALDLRYTEVRDLESARRAPSLQLVGSPERRSIDLGSLADQGVRIAGHLRTVQPSGTATFSADLDENIAFADAALSRKLDQCDAYATAAGLDRELSEPDRPSSVSYGVAPASVDLTRERVRTVVWATGFRPDYPWLHLPVFNSEGAICHQGGVVCDTPGLYLMGLPFMRRRKSSFIDGVADDARDLSAHLVAALHHPHTRSLAASHAA